MSVQISCAVHPIRTQVDRRLIIHSHEEKKKNEQRNNVQSTLVPIGKGVNKFETRILLKLLTHLNRRFCHF